MHPGAGHAGRVKAICGVAAATLFVTLSCVEDPNAGGGSAEGGGAGEPAGAGGGVGAAGASNGQAGTAPGSAGAESAAGKASSGGTAGGAPPGAGGANMTAGGVAGAEAATAAGASGAGAMNGPPCGQDTDCESGKHCVGSQPADVCVRDEDWTCSIWNDCTWSDSCSRLDHKCHLARQLGESCSDDYRCVFPVLCDGVCTAPDEVDPDIWACASNGCELGTFCRYYPATSGADCWDIRTDFEGWPCASADFNCGPLFTCVSGECKARATTYPSCASSETVCNVHSFCDHSRGVTCRPRRFAGENCQNEPAACELGAFCNSQGRCQDYPAEGQPCDAGRCVVSMKCGTQLAGGVCAPD